MERPEPCKTLFEFMNDEGQGKLQEPLAKIIFRQIVEAIIHCLSRGIFHTDIKLENILIQKTTYQVKLIDFGCAIYEETDRAELIGDQNCFPPEFFLADTFVVEPANVWALGVNLFYLVCGHLPFRNTEQLVSGIFHIQKGLSRECESLIRHCLAFKEDDRPTPEEILLHPWLD
ncbi:PIM1 kinase, partial [Polypterus senegalus]|nr:PIM1 kinase [Polypterus senegalus]